MKQQPRLLAVAVSSDDRPTPQELFDQWNAEFKFTLDVAASRENAKCERYFTVEDDGLQQPWSGVVWCNPPYSEYADWVRKANQEMLCGVKSVLLLPAATDTRVFHDYIWNKPYVEVRFLRGRVRFGNSPGPAPFASMLVIFGADL